MGKELGKRPPEGKVCLHLGRLIGAVSDQIPVEKAEQALVWAVERGFGHPASIDQPRES